MRKSLAVFFLIVFAFHLGGYYLVFIGLQYRASQQLIRLADANTYDANDEIVFRIPLTLPYPISQEEFTRANGTFEHDGEHYQLIKQKIVGSELMLVCLKNHQQKKLSRALTDLSKTSPVDAKQALRTLAKFFKDYQSSDTEVLQAGQAWSQALNHSVLTPALRSLTPEVTGPPPRLS